MNSMNRLYGPKMKLIHPRIAKLWAKIKCDRRMQRWWQEEHVSFHEQIILSKYGSDTVKDCEVV
jgi:hypothetical protein